MLAAGKMGGAANSKPNGGRAESLLGSAGKYVTAAMATAVAARATTGFAKKVGGGLTSAAADAGQKALEAVGQAVDRHAERLSKDYNARSDPRFDPRSLFDGSRTRDGR
jgi:hypothetical protein